MTLVTIVGLGATGSNVAQLLASEPEFFGLKTSDTLRLVELKEETLNRVSDSLAATSELNLEPTLVSGGQSLSNLRATGLASLISSTKPNHEDAVKEKTAEIVVLATPARGQYRQAFEYLTAGCHVICMTDDLAENRRLLRLSSFASKRQRSLVVGASFSPGLSCLLVNKAAAELEQVSSIAVARAGTAGPSCARQHHSALKQAGPEWNGTGWTEKRGGTGRDLAWFPEPIKGRDCYRAGLVNPLLIQRRYSDADSIVARMAATRRDRMTSWLPMIRKPHKDGGPGAIRVEVRGTIKGQYETRVLGLSDNPSFGAAAAACEATNALLNQNLPVGVCGLIDIDDESSCLRRLNTIGIKYSTFEGVPETV